MLEVRSWEIGDRRTRESNSHLLTTNFCKVKKDMEQQQKSKIQTFRDLITWQEGHKLVLMIYEATKAFPKAELYGLTDQMRRAVVSITSNIAEGFTRQSVKEKIQFYSIAAGSITEIQNQLAISKDVHYLDDKKADAILEQSLKTLKILNGLIRSTRSRLKPKLATCLLVVFLLSPISPLLTPNSHLLTPQLALASTISVSPPNTLNNGLVGYWTLDGKDTNWATGITLDKSGNGNNGQLVSMSTSSSPVAGKVGQALVFNGVGSSIILPNITVGLNSSISFWMKVKQPGLRIIFNNTQSSAQRFVVFFNGNRLYITNKVWDGIMSSSVINYGQWYHVYINIPDINSTSTLKMYINGSDATSPAHSQQFDPYPMTTIGTNVAPWTFNGLLDDIRIYNRALSVSEIQQLYNMGAATKLATSPKVNPSNCSGTSGLSCGLVGYWTLDGKDTNWATGITLDKSGNGNNGQLVNMSTSTSPVAGKVGQGLRFIRTSSTKILLNGVSLGTVHTAVAWIKPNNQSGSYNFGGIFNGNTDNIDPLFVRGPSPIGFGYSSNIGTVEHSGNSLAGKWHQIVSVRNGTSVNLYLDGVWVASGNLVDNVAAVINTIGMRDTSLHYDGFLDDIRIYNRALSATEIQQLYNMGAATKLAASPKIATSTCSSTSGLSCGLVGYWTLDGKDTNWSTGITLDKSGNGNNGQLVSMSTSSSPVAGKVGQGLTFKGVGYTNAGTGSALNVIGSDFSVSVWAKTNQIGTTRMILQKGSGPAISSEKGYQLYLGNTGTNWVFSVWDGASPTNHTPRGQTTYGVEIGKWHYLTGIFRTSTKTAYLYVDGILRDQASNASFSTPDISTNPLFIGASSDGSTLWNGLLDDIRIYNRALSATEVQQLYQMGR